MTTIPVQAQNIQAIQSSSVGAQIEYNNQWGQSFEATGPNIGPTSILPFQALSTSALALPNSGTATLEAAVTHLSPRGGELDASGSIDSSSTSNIVLSQDTTNGVPSISFNPTTASTADSVDEDDTLAANILGTNIGVDIIQVTGTNSYTVVNTLTAF